MKTRLLTIIALLFLVPAVHAADIPVAATSEKGEADTIKRTFTVRPGGEIVLDLDRGSVKVRTVRGNEVHLVFERNVTGVDEDNIKEFLERHELDIRQSGDRIFVDSRFEEEDRRWGRSRSRTGSKFKLDVTVLVPEQYSIDFQNGAGNIEIEDLTGNITGITGAGNVLVSRISGSVDVTSGAGNVEVFHVDGRLAARSGAGNIVIREIAGRLEAHTGAGDVEVYLTRQPRGDSDLSSGAGNVTVYLDPGLAVKVEAHSSLGSAKTDFDLPVSGKWMSKSFEGILNGGGPALVLNSGVGNVSLRRN